MNLRNYGLLYLAALVGSTPALAQPSTMPPELAFDETMLPYTDTDQSVMLPDGRALHMVCMGEGSPTVILSAGQGDWSAAWSKVQPKIAQTTRVCSWDRPGFGLSDGTQFEATVATNAADLETALLEAEINGPYVLVGHSLGSYETFLFADHNLERLAGMVLIDPSLPNQPARMERIAPSPKLGEAEQQGPSALWRSCAAALRTGGLSESGPDPDGCFALPPYFPLSVRQALRAKLASNPIQFETAAEFFANGLNKGAQIVINPRRDYAALPLYVLSSTVVPFPPDFPIEERRRVEAMVQESNSGWLEIASLSTRGINSRVPASGHYIHQEKPQVVVDTIEAVVREVRAAGLNSTPDE
ncbi:alpha/beta fold hydrolase [Aurantiacibacter suaedae]|uniref:alpha/beta fold hydrolase n=1 Tax=Aurantiacibacter suaedae TaxID=2545755 RepID=UPI0010F957AB|nr:alpha/beta hydrolase [Aurantiacibacter suaedae]